jgi:DNA polymerase III delta subunit
VITIFCGEDTVAARTAYTQTIDKLKTADTEVLFLQPSSVLEINKGLADSMSLFSSQKIFCVENLEKYSFKKSTKAKKDLMYETLLALSTDKTIVLLDFEDGKQARQLKLKDLAKVYESKPVTSIFKLLDDCVPGNKLGFIESLRTVCETQDEMFAFVMLFRHIRLLLVTLHDGPSAKLPPWQKFKIIGQAKKWQKKALTDYYSGLIRIEISSKTSSNPYGIAKSLEILACHYL